MSIKGLLDEADRTRLVIALLRISTGVMFLLAAWPKISAGGDWTGRMLGFLRAQENTAGWYRSLLESIVVPNAEVFAFLTAYGELAVGLALVLGLLSRLALVAALVMVVNYLLAKGVPFWTPSSNDSYLILILLTLVLLRAGHFLGLDAWLAARRRDRR
ncbi:MAG TPA: DoxX family membrane protein [Lysobacter sp.]|nr:DoxX family membrane protein [Lysobacter sp.]